jgi:hypothetical protein
MNEIAFIIFFNLLNPNQLDTVVLKNEQFIFISTSKSCLSCQKHLVLYFNKNKKLAKHDIIYFNLIREHEVAANFVNEYNVSQKHYFIRDSLTHYDALEEKKQIFYADNNTAFILYISEKGIKMMSSDDIYSENKIINKMKLKRMIK